MDSNKFTQKAREAVEAAHRLADRHSHSQIEPEHLLLGLMHQADGVVPQIVAQLNVDPANLTSAVQDAVRAELEDLINREAEPEKALVRSHIREAISVAAGEEDHELVSPSGDVDPGPAGLLVFDAGSITFSTL